MNERAKLPKVPTFTPWGAIYREEEEVVVYVYFMVWLKIRLLEFTNKSLNAANKSLELINRPLNPLT